MKKLSTRLVAAAALVLAIGAGSSAAADPRHADRDWQGHEVRAHHDWRRPHPPGYVYAPPVVYAPPPVETSPGLNLIIPLHIH